MISIVIPALNPNSRMLQVVQAIRRRTDTPIVVVNDGSSAAYDDVFAEVQSIDNVWVVRHAVNLGKGQALKTAFNFVLNTFQNCTGIVTVDADGQHHEANIAAIVQRLADKPDQLIIGVRSWTGSDIPFRSRAGNLITRLIFGLFVGKMVQDTQTGLRGIPVSFAKRLLKLPAMGYEFELEMLITAIHQKINIHEVPIQTIYLDGNRESHFHPLWDSLKIYFVFLRFSALAIISELSPYNCVK